MIDTRTQEKLERVKLTASFNGWDYDEALDRAQLLLTDARRREVELRVLEDMVAKMDSFTATQLAGKDQTVAGAVTGCRSFIEMYIAMVGGV